MRPKSHTHPSRTPCYSTDKKKKLEMELRDGENILCIPAAYLWRERYLEFWLPRNQINNFLLHKRALKQYLNNKFRLFIWIIIIKLPLKKLKICHWRIQNVIERIKKHYVPKQKEYVNYNSIRSVIYVNPHFKRFSPSSALGLPSNTVNNLFKFAVASWFKDSWLYSRMYPVDQLAS